MPTPLQEEYREILLTQGQVARVSIHRFDELSRFKWHAWWNKWTQSYYARRHAMASDGKCCKVYMHRQILGLVRGDKLQGDHRNHDTLNNQDWNLRVATNHQNQLNKPAYACNKTGFKGVYRLRPNAYRASIRLHGKSIFLGVRKTAEEASALYAQAASRLHGEFAHIDQLPG